MKSKTFPDDGSVIEVTETYLVIISNDSNTRYFAIPLFVIPLFDIHKASIINAVNKFDNASAAIKFINAKLHLTKIASPAFNDSITNAEELSEARYYIEHGQFRVEQYHHENNDNTPYHLQTFNIPRNKDGKLMFCYDDITKKPRLCRV